MKRPTENQQRARAGKGCLFSVVKRSCGEAPEVEIEGITLRVCAFHQKLIRSIVRDAKETKAGRHPRQARAA